MLLALARVREPGGRVRAARARREAARDAATEAHRAAVLQLVCEVAADVLVHGCADLELTTETSPFGETSVLRLRPVDPGAAAVELRVEYGQIALDVGRSTWEIWQPDHGERLDRLRDLLIAVIEGRYVERVERGRVGPKLIGTFETTHGREVFTRSGADDYGFIGETRYSPYCPTTTN